METVAYYNGRLGLAKELSIPLSDRSIYFGDAVYDAALCRGGRIFLKDEHIERFFQNAEKLKIAHTYTKKKIADILSLCVKAAGNGVFFLYFQLSRNAPERKHDYTVSDGANLLVTVSGTAMPDPEARISLITAEDTRYFHCDVKTVNLLPAVIASGNASLLGADETVLHRGKTVTECAHSNVSIIKHGVLYTHPLCNLILPGITRRHLLLACKNLDIRYEERPFSLTELCDADEILVSSTTRLCVRAHRLNGKPCGGKSPRISALLCRYLFDEFVHFD